MISEHRAVDKDEYNIDLRYRSLVTEAIDLKMGSEAEIALETQLKTNVLYKSATLSDFYAGPEALIGAPNPKIFQGMHNEHCARSNADVSFVTDNYNIRTCPRLEWEFVVDPKPLHHYAHTPRNKNFWEIGSGWKGEHGRDIISLHDLFGEPEVRRVVLRAGMTKEEVISIRLASGPMFVLVRELLFIAPSCKFCNSVTFGSETQL